jgi:hypothetical protein
MGAPAQYRNLAAMTEPTEPKRSLLANALAGGKSRSSAPRTDDAFDKEVDEELQRERLQQIWHQYSGYILAGMAALILCVGAYKLIEHRRQAASEAAGARYVSAINELTGGKIEDGSRSLAALAKGSGGFATIAKLRIAAAEAAAGKTADALAKYDALSNDKSLGWLLSGFARLQTAMLSLDTASWDDMRGRLAELVSDKSPWRYNAQELLGMAALKAGKTEEARAQFERLASDQGVPTGIAGRARIVMGSIVASEMAIKVPPTPQTPPQNAPQKK